MHGFPSATILSILVLALTLIAHPAGAQDVKMLRIGTGGLLGVYYPVGKALAEGITKAGIAPDLIALAQTSGGSEDNVRALAAGEIEAGLVQADTAHRALKGQGTFAGNVRAAGIRAVASLYPERLQIIARRDANIRGVTDLRGKSISLDMTGSGTLAVMRIVLEAHGLTESDLSPVYLKPEFSQERLAQGKLHGVCLMAGTPAKAVSDIIGPDFSLVPVKADMAARIAERHPYLVPGLIPAGVYPGVPETETVEVRALLVVREDMDEALVHELAEAIWSAQTLDLLRLAHVQGRSVKPESALTGLSIPLHAGARRFYQERGLLPNGSPVP